VHLWLYVAFSFVNGWIDAICLRRYKCFVTMMVGNTLTMGDSIANSLYPDEDDDALLTAAWFQTPAFYVSLIASFMAGVFVHGYITKYRGWSGRHFAPLVVLWICAHDVWEGYNQNCTGQPDRWNALRLAPVFGIQNAISIKGGLAALPWCTTSNVVTIAYTLTELTHRKINADERRKFNISLCLLGGMMIGAISGATFDLWRLSYDEGCGPGAFGIMVMAPFLGALFWMHDLVFKLNTFSARGASGYLADKIPALLDVETQPL